MYLPKKGDNTNLNIFSSSVDKLSTAQHNCARLLPEEIKLVTCKKCIVHILSARICFDIEISVNIRLELGAPLKKNQI